MTNSLSRQQRQKPMGDRAQIWRAPHLHNTVFLRADLCAQRFDRHFHEEFAIGIIESDCQAFAHDQGRRLDIPSGSVALIAPGHRSRWMAGRQRRLAVSHALSGARRHTTGWNDYFVMQATRPQTIGYSLADSPVGLAAWMLDHDRHSDEQISGLLVDGQPFGDITRDDILDNITLYWVTNTGTSAGRLYWENARIPYKGEVSVSAAFTVFPGEAWRAPRSWVERTYRNLVHFHEVDKGGHFAAWDQPELFSAEVRAAFRSLRQSI
jgi:pimeloyl-ACP methyl ester carboxylesterase